MIEIILIIITFIIICLCYTIFLTMILVGFFGGAPFVPTNKKYVEKIINSIDLTPGKIAYDLGSGDGRFVFELADKGLDARGIELGLPTHLYARLRQIIFKKGGKLIRGNVYKKDFSDADIIFVYLFPEMLKKLKPVFIKNLKPDTLIISHAFSIDGWDPIKTITKTKTSPTIFIYKV